MNSLKLCVCVFAASDLDSIRALFNEKEKELSLAVAKVEELTRQLEELKRGRGTNARDQQQQMPSPAALELDKLRRELMVCLTIQFACCI
jgi:apoptosis-stimulating of p53 protein 1